MNGENLVRLPRQSELTRGASWAWVELYATREPDGIVAVWARATIRPGSELLIGEHWKLAAVRRDRMRPRRLLRVMRTRRFQELVLEIVEGHESGRAVMEPYSEAEIEAQELIMSACK